MKRSITLLMITAAALLLAFASSAPLAVAQNGNRIIVPDSSIEHPEDIGVRAPARFFPLAEPKPSLWSMPSITPMR